MHLVCEVMYMGYTIKCQEMAPITTTNQQRWVHLSQVKQFAHLLHQRFGDSLGFLISKQLGRGGLYECVTLHSASMSSTLKSGDLVSTLLTFCLRKRALFPAATASVTARGICPPAFRSVVLRAKSSPCVLSTLYSEREREQQGCSWKYRVM